MNEYKNTISDYNTLMMYWNDKKLLKMRYVKETIEFLTNFHKKNDCGKPIVLLGEKLLKEYSKTNNN